MAMTINGTNGVTFNDGTSMSTGQQACKAWVNFNGSGTVAIRAAYNVSSITDNGTGDYTINFTNAMPDANYSYTLAFGDGGSGSNSYGYIDMPRTSAPTTTAIRMILRKQDTGAYDFAYIALNNP
jgi:hypothetical protein